MTSTSKGAVAAGHQLTAQAAADVLHAGGNAFDAAIAGLWVACVAEPVLASPGGGGFLMAHEGLSGSTTLYDFFVQTPLRKRNPAVLDFTSVHADFGTATQEFHIGQGASATPGFVPGIYAVHEDLGTMPMSELLQVAIGTARDGLVMTRFQAFLSQVVSPILLASESAGKVFAPAGALVPEGATFTNSALAGFLDGLACEGLAFYGGEAADAFCAAQVDAGQLRAEDFARYRVLRRQPLGLPAMDATIALNPPPSAGGAFIAHALHGLGAEKAATLPAIAQALARADRARIRHKGDVAAILSDAGIDWADEPGGGPATRGTSHISVVDARGNAAAVTVSNGEGNGHVVDHAGFMLNNMLGEEDLNPKGFHGWHEGARLSSNMCPAVAHGQDGAVVALGSGGSNRIRSAVFQVLVRMLAQDMSPEDAVQAARVHVESGHLDFEDDLETGDRDALTTAFPDHRAWAERNLFFGGCNVVRRTAAGTCDAAGDARRGGRMVVL